MYFSRRRYFSAQNLTLFILTLISCQFQKKLKRPTLIIINQSFANPETKFDLETVAQWIFFGITERFADPLKDI
jgi:hypothetical protein